MANLYQYASSNDKTGYFLRGRSKNSGYYNLQTTAAANQLFSNLDYEAGRIPHTEGESVPGELTWRMYRAGLLETDNPNSALDTLSGDELKETFEQSEEALSLSEADLQTIHDFIESYSGADSTRVGKLETLIDIPNQNNSNTDSDSGEDSDFDNSDSDIPSRQSRRLEEAGTSLEEIEHRIEQLEEDNENPIRIETDEIISYPGGPQSFTNMWNSSASITAIYGAELFDTMFYFLEYSSEEVDELEFRVTDYSLFDPIDGVDEVLATSSEIHPEAIERDHDYTVEFTEHYDPEDVPNEEVELYLGEKPLLNHTILIDNERIQKWSVEVGNHEWSDTLQLRMFRRASNLISVLTSFFDDFDGYSLESPVHDYNELSIDFKVDWYDEERKERLRGAIKEMDSED